MKIKIPKPKRLFLTHWPRKKTLKKLWAFFLLFNLVFSQSLAPLAQGFGNEINSSAFFTTEQFRPQQILLVDNNFSPLKWESQEKSLIPELQESSTLEKFSSANSATLVFTSTTTTATTTETNLLPNNIPDPVTLETKTVSTTPDNFENFLPEATSTTTTVESQLQTFATEEILVTLPETTSSTEATNLIPLVPAEILNAHGEENSLSTTTEKIIATETQPSQSPEELTSSTPQEILPEPEKQLTSPALEYSRFVIDEGSNQNSNSKNPEAARIKLSFASLPISSGQLQIEYSLASSSWQTLNSISLDKESANADRGGFFSVNLPPLAVSQLSALNIRLKLIAAETAWANIYAGELFFLDAIWLEADYKTISPEEEEDLLAAQQLDSLTPEEFAHLEFFSPLMELFMPADLSSNPITVGSNKSGFNSLPLQMLPVNVSTATPPTRLGQKVVYTDAYKSTDLEYIMSDSGLKENIILKTKNHPSRFRYLTNLDKYDAVQTSPSTIVLYAKGHKGQILYKRYVLSAPIMTDSQGNSSSQLVFKINKNLITLIPDASWLKTASYPVTVDPNVDLSILNVSSFPVAGEFWTIGFTTVGQDNLTVTPGDQATIDDMEFSSLTCDGIEVPATVSITGQVSAENWSCDGIGEIKFLDKKTGHHHMAFAFGSASQDAYNGANVWNGLAGDSNWATGGNWSLGTPPALADDVVISTAGTINLNSAGTINSLVVGNSGGGVASVLNFNYNAIAGTPLAITGDLTVYSGASITHQVASSTSATASIINGTINLSVSGNTTIAGSINADSKGYPMSHGPGTPSMINDTNGTGASHGGIGGKGNGTQVGTLGSVYGSSTAPTELGSGGGKACGLSPTASDTGAYGGGAIKIYTTGTTTVSGSISATGSSSNTSPCWRAGLGSGGSVYITTGSFLGAGTISANGGSSHETSAGGGGRVAVYYTTDSSTISFQAYGGNTRPYQSADRYAGAGTVYRKAASQTYGTLILSNNSIGSTDETVFGLTPIIATTTLDSLTISNSSYVYLNAASTTLASTTSLTISGNGLYEAISSTTLNYGSLSWTGTIIDGGGTLPVLNQNQDLTIPINSKLIFNVLSGTRSYNNLTVNGTLTHSSNISATTGSVSLYKIDWTANGNLTIGASGSIDVSAKGFSAGKGPGTGSSSASPNSAGASYGGLGADATDSVGSAGAVYGSLTQPTDLGSGGGLNCGTVGGTFYGGGAVKLTVTGTTTISGTINANANDSGSGCWSGSRGSGGSVYLTTGTLSGNGSINSRGGAGAVSSYVASNGGGGRIAVHYTTDSSTVTYNVYGGNHTWSRYGGSGTIYKKSSLQTYGDVVLDNNNLGTTNETTFGLTPISSSTLDSLTIKNSASVYLTASSATTTTLTLSNNGHYNNKSGTTLNYSSLSWGGMLTDSGGTLAVLSQNQDITIPTSSKLTFNVLNGTRTYNNIVVNGTLTHSPNTSAVTASTDLYKINWTANGNLTVGSSGAIDVTGKGYIGGQGTGAGLLAANYASGGGYGGAGGASSQVSGGIAYGSAANPTHLGSGGGNTTCPGTGAYGGGAVILNVTGTTTLLGTVSANGNPGGNVCWYVGGGSGGTLNLTTNALAGTGSITANGGAGSNNAGAGGGGRISILANLNTATLTRSVEAGTIAGGGAASVGTTYPTDYPSLSTETETDNNNGTSVTGNGTIISIGYYPITQYGHVWSTWANPYIPNTNMATTSIGGTPIASKVNQGAITYAFDGVASTYWGSSEGFSYDLEYDFPTTTVVNKYIVTAHTSAGDSPKDWQFQAWDGASWQNLQSVSNQTGWGSYESRAFTLVNTTPYTKYRLYISGNNGGGWTRVAELQMLNTGGDISTNGATSTIGSFTSSITGLSTNTTYHTRSYTTTQAGTVYGNDILFSTGPANGAPNSPSSLGPNNFTTNSWGTTTAPTLTFNLSDPEVADTVKYRIIIDNDSNFSSPLVDYTSALQAQGSASFTVGQLAGSGSYAIGSSGQTLGDHSSYYWKVQAIDSSTATSAYALANSGSIAFKVDTTAPVAGIVAISHIDTTYFTVVSSGATDTGSGIASYFFTNLTNLSTNGPTVSTGWNSSGLTPNTEYSFNIAITDTAGNTATTVSASEYTLANTPSNATTTVISNSSILLAWNNNSNPVGTEYYAENSTSEFNSGWITATSTLFTGLTCGTSYTFHVKARNADGTQTAYSASVSPSASPCNNNPSSPSSLGYSQHTNGGWTNDSTPDLVFTLTDSDASDTVKYRIQVATSSDFSALIVDYTSALLSQGQKTFTTGQATSSGSYSVGFAGQTLADNSTGYYWRVMATDNNLATSAWVTAAAGAVAFKLETVAPVVGILSVSNTTNDSVTLLFSGASDADSGLAGTPYVFFNTTNWNYSGYTTATTWTNSGLSAGTYSYKIRVSDVAGNFVDVLLPSSVTVAGSGGGGSPEDPWSGSVTTGFSVYINQNDSITNTQNVTLQLTGQPGTTQMLVSNLANFAGASLEAYDTTKFWDLCSGLGSCTNGTYTVYAKFYNALSQSSGSVSDNITYQILNSLTPGSLSLTSVSTSTASILISGSADAIYGLAVNPYTFKNRNTGSQSATSSTSSWINTGLTPNTQYSYYAIVGNANSDFGNTADISAYTLANPPVSLTAPASTETSITLNWLSNSNPNGTEYQVLNQTSSIASNWVTSTSTTVSGLTCATPYNFKVRARNSNGVETDYTSSVVASTSACAPVVSSGGGGGGGSGGNCMWYNNLFICFDDYVTNPQPQADPVWVPDYVENKKIVEAPPAKQCKFTDNTGWYGWYYDYPKTHPQMELGSNNFNTNIGDPLSKTSRWASDLYDQKYFRFAKTSLDLKFGRNYFPFNYDTLKLTAGNAQYFGVKWESKVTALKPGYYNFRITSDDDSWLYVDGVLVGNNAGVHAARTILGAVYLDGVHNFQIFFAERHTVEAHFYFEITPRGDLIFEPINSDCEIAPLPDTVKPKPPVITPVNPIFPPVVVSEPVSTSTIIVVTPVDTIKPNEDRGEDNSLSDPKIITPSGPSIIENVGREIKILAETTFRSAITESKLLLLASSLPLKSFFNNLIKIKNSQNTAVGISALTLAPASLYLEYSLASHGLNINAVGSLAEIWLRLLQWFYALMAATGLRKKRRYWGTVYDSESKQPLDPAIVELIDPITGKVLEQNITDMYGRFGFLDRPGTFVIRAAKTNYRFPSQTILGKTDLVFENLYHGEQLNISSDNGIITPNIPMDPMAFDWNQMDKQRVVKINPKFEYALHIVLQTLFWSGAIFVLVNFILLPNLFNSVSISIYLLMIIMRRLIPHAHLWGRIIFNNGQRANHLLIELHPIKIPTVVTGRAVTAESGKFFLKAIPGKYVMTIKKVDGLTNTVLYKQDVTVGKDGVANEIITL